MSGLCEEYYRCRASEIAGQLAEWTQSAAVRDESFVRLLRAKVERRARLADAVAKMSRDAVAETRHALVANNERATAASEKAVVELGRFVDVLRRAGDDSGEATAAALDAENARLREVVKLRREALAKAAAAGRATGDRLRQDQAVNDRMAHNAIAATTCCDDPPADLVETS